MARIQIHSNDLPGVRIDDYKSDYKSDNFSSIKIEIGNDEIVVFVGNDPTR